MISVLLSYWCEFIPVAFYGYASGYMHAIPVENLKSVGTTFPGALRSDPANSTE